MNSPALLRRLRVSVSAAPLGDLRDGISLDIVAELAAAHHGLLASKLAKKVSTVHGAIQNSMFGKQ